MALFDEIFGAELGDSPENRPESSHDRPAKSEHSCGESPRSPESPGDAFGKVAPCGHCGCGSHWQDAAGWHCESCEPSTTHTTRWLQVPGGKAAPMSPPTLAWPAELTEALKRVSVAFEWTRQDIADFCRWARRSPQALADAAEFLRNEAAIL